MMHSFISLAASLLALTSVAVASPTPCPINAGKAIYFLNNEPEENAVIAVPITGNGSLAGGTITPTGGKGGISLDGQGQFIRPDPLLSQGSIIVVDNLIFAVNAGSNTVSLFLIDPFNAVQLTLVGAPVLVPGHFPNTVAASLQHGLVCVGTTGSLAGVSCARFDAVAGIGVFDELRRFDIGQSTPPVGPFNTISQVFFSDDQSRLHVTFKGDAALNIEGFLSTFLVVQEVDGLIGLGRQGFRSFPEGLNQLFGAQVIPGTNDIFVSDASFGGAILSVDDNSLLASALSLGNIAGQFGTSFAAISPLTNSVFVTDIGVQQLFELSLIDASVIGSLNLAGLSSVGFIDVVAINGMVFILSADVVPQVLVIDARFGIAQARLVQNFNLAQLGVGANAQGLALFL